MVDDMSLFRTTIAIASLTAPDRRIELADVLVDTGSKYNWVPSTILDALGIAPDRVERFETADGRILERDVGFAMIHTSGRSTPTRVVFANDGDMVLLGAIALDGLNLRVDLLRRQLVSAGPVPVAQLALA